ncbi:hypothetical protein Nepgr_010562, partial [Nepenthes gracilis]
IKELNSYVGLRKTYMSSLGNKKVELFDMGAGVSEPIAEESIQLASSMTNQELIDAGKKTMDGTDQAIEHSKQLVVAQTIEVGTQTAVNLKGQTEQMGHIVNELDTIQFSVKKASQLVKEIGRQVATDKCIMLFLFLIVCGVIAIIVVKEQYLQRTSQLQSSQPYSIKCSKPLGHLHLPPATGISYSTPPSANITTTVNVIFESKSAAYVLITFNASKILRLHLHLVYWQDGG